MTVDEHFRGAHPVPTHVRIVELHALVILQRPSYFFSKYTLAHSVDHDELALAVPNGRLQRALEIGKLIAEALGRAQM